MLSSRITDRRFLFFGGKGGVGKTTWACAAAVWWALKQRMTTLLLSLDPAHSLADVLERPVGPDEREVLPNLVAQELNAEREFERFMKDYRGPLRLLVDRGTYLDEEDIDAFLRLSLPGLDELMGLFRLAELATDERFQRVIVDLAPTGHGLRLPALTADLQRMSSLLNVMEDKHKFTVQALV
ncbi:MAG: ArsA family ATPase, partial [Chloroflexota bacterium]|nr:ArsA family ATPase [Chloroflexota bacterium]